MRGRERVSADGVEEEGWRRIYRKYSLLQRKTTVLEYVIYPYTAHSNILHQLETNYRAN